MSAQKLLQAQTIVDCFLSHLDEDTSSDMSGSEHTLSATVKTNIQMGEQGLGLILIQNGPYIQISSLVEKSAAVRDGKLQPGKQVETTSNLGGAWLVCGRNRKSFYSSKGKPLSWNSLSSTACCI